MKRLLAVAVLLALGLEVAVAQLPRHDYRGTAGYLVTPVAVAGDVTSDNADRAARDYATVLTSDDVLVAGLARAAGRSSEQVRQHLAAAYVPRSSTLFVQYDGRSAQEVRQVFAALDALARGQDGPTERLPTAVVRPLGLPGVGTRTDPLRRVPGEPTVAALLLVLTAALALRRARPRATRRALQAGTTLPVLPGQDLEAVVLRLAQDAPGLVVVRPATAATAGLVEQVTDGLREAAARLGVPAGSVVFTSSDRAPGDATVLVGTEGGSLRALEDALDEAPAHAVLVLA